MMRCDLLQNHFLACKMKFHLSSKLTFFDICNSVVEGGERGLYSVALIRFIPQATFALFQRVDPGQDLLLHVVYFVLE